MCRYYLTATTARVTSPFTEEAPFVHLTRHVFEHLLSYYKHPFWDAKENEREQYLSSDTYINASIKY